MGFFKNPFKSIKKLFSDPGDWLKNAAESSWDVVAKPTGAVLGKFSPIPTWEEAQRPGQWLAGYADTTLGDAAPYAGAALSVANPWLGAGYSSLYGAGKMQEGQKGMDWGAVGKDALKNFGTAAIQTGANKLVSNADAARATDQFRSTSPYSMKAGFEAATAPGSNLGKTALEGFDTAAAVQNIGTGMPTTASATPAMTLGDRAYEGAVKGGSQIGTNALASTLAPSANQPISGMSAGYGSTVGAPSGEGYKFGDILSAFGNPDQAGTITPDQVNAMTMRVGANNFLQRQGARDRFLPAGQIEPEVNTPYGGQLEDINKGTDKAYQDLLKEIDNYNTIKRISEANPNVPIEKINEYIQNPDLLDPSSRQYVQGLMPMNMFNTSLIR